MAPPDEHPRRPAPQTPEERARSAISRLAGTGAGSGPWRRADPRARLLATVTCAALILTPERWAPLLLALLAALALLALSGARPAETAAALRPFRLLLLFTAGMHLLFTPGEPLAPGLLPGFVTGAGALAAAAALCRLGAVIAISARLVATTSPLELARSLGWVIAPTRALGVPVREVTLVLALAFHFFPVLLDEGRQVRAALESRGISLRHPRPRLRARALFSWTLAVLFGMADRSTRLATALEAKGFALERPPRHRFPPWSGASTALVAASVAALAAAVAVALG
jgi:energy-coupling factor transport system permease protein